MSLREESIAPRLLSPAKVKETPDRNRPDAKRIVRKMEAAMELPKGVPKSSKRR